MAHGYYNPDTETWVTGAEQQKEYDAMQELAEIEQDIRHQRAYEDHMAGLVTTGYWPIAVALARAESDRIAREAHARRLARLPGDEDAPVVEAGAVPLDGDGMLSERDCRELANLLDELRWDPEHAPQGDRTRDDYRHWSRTLRRYATTLAAVRAARTSGVGAAA